MSAVCTVSTGLVRVRDGKITVSRLCDEPAVRIVTFGCSELHVFEVPVCTHHLLNVDPDPGICARCLMVDATWRNHMTVLDSKEPS